jgi:hypothetical protein
MTSTYSKEERQPYKQFVEDTLAVICLTSTSVDINEFYQLEQFTHNEVYQLTDADLFADFITNFTNKKRFFWIVDGTFCRNAIPLLHDIPQVHSIYVLDRIPDTEWLSKYSKIKGAFSSPSSIRNAIEEQLRETERGLVTISIFDSTSIDYSSRVIDINQLDPIFMYSQLLKYIILDMDFNQREKEQLFSFLRSHHAANVVTLNMITTFEQDYARYSPVRW